MNKRIGIFAGSFDPVHKGHVAFALEAIRQAKLDEVYFLPEIQPRAKDGVTHIGHRIAMLRLALKPYRHLRVLELPDKQFTVAKTLPRLERKFTDDKLFLLMGSDILNKLSIWPNSRQLLKKVGLIVAYGRTKPDPDLPIKPKEIYLLKSPKPDIASRNIRRDVALSKPAPGLLKSIKTYISENWLYKSIR